MKPLRLIVALASLFVSLGTQAQEASFELKQYVPGLRVTGAAQQASPVQPTLGPWGPFEGTVGDSPLALSPPSSDSSGSWAYASSNPAVALVDGSTLTWLSAGTATLTATQAAAPGYTATSTTAALLSNPASPPVALVTGYWSLRVDFANSGYISVPAPSVTSLGYTDTCAGTVATGGSSYAWASTASLDNTSNWPAQSRVVCIPAAASDVAALSSLATYASESGGWFKWHGRALAMQAGGERWVVAGLLSTDTAGAYPSWNSRRIFAIKVPSFTGQQSVLVDRKSGADVSRTLNYPLP